MATDDGRKKGCDDREDEFDVDADTSEPEADTILYVQFKTIQNRRSSIRSFFVPVENELMEETAYRLEKDAQEAAIWADVRVVIFKLGQHIFMDNV